MKRFPEKKYKRISRGLGLHLSYESAIEVLRTFHSIHGHLVIPRRYTIPPTSIPQQHQHQQHPPSYPKEWHNIDIASTVYSMNWWTMNVKSNPQRVKELNSLGFVWERLQPEWNLVLEAIVIYKEIYGHVKVPATFVVPYEKEHDHGDNYYSHNNNHHHHHHHHHHHNDENDDDNSSYKISWPKATWGIPLGNCVHRIRTRGDFLRDDEVSWSRRRQLDGLGFIWDVQEHSFERFFYALKIFSKLEYNQKRRGSKALRIPRSFVIPSTAYIDGPADGGRSRSRSGSCSKMINPWPKELWGYPLGVKSAAIRQKGLYIKNNPERQRALQDIGFQMSGNNTIGWLNIVWASAIYSKIHGEGKLDVPIHFVVPSPPSSSPSSHRDNDHNDHNDPIYDLKRSDNLDSIGVDSIGVDESWPWPEQLWGFPLGQRLKDVRLKGSHLKNEESAPARRAQLDALGFVWQPKRGRRKRCLGG